MLPLMLLLSITSTSSGHREAFGAPSRAPSSREPYVRPESIGGSYDARSIDPISGQQVALLRKASRKDAFGAALVLVGGLNLLAAVTYAGLALDSNMSAVPAAGPGVVGMLMTLIGGLLLSSAGHDYVAAGAS